MITEKVGVRPATTGSTGVGAMIGLIQWFTSRTDNAATHATLAETSPQAPRRPPDRAALALVGTTPGPGALLPRGRGPRGRCRTRARPPDGHEAIRGPGGLPAAALPAGGGLGARGCGRVPPPRTAVAGLDHLRRRSSEPCQGDDAHPAPPGRPRDVLPLRRPASP